MDYPVQSPEHVATTGAAQAYGPAPHLAVERHALRLPSHTAVTDATARWSYWQLSCAADQVAKLLAERGLETAGRVGVVKRRAAGFVAAILGCLKAGIPFCVIEAGAPDSARQLGISTVLDPAPSEPADAGPVIDLSVLLLDTTSGPHVPPESGPELPGQYTHWAAERFDLTGNDRFGVLPGSSGQLVCALCTALSVGATLSISPDATADNAGALAQWLRDNAVSVVYLSPPLLRAMTAQDPVPQLSLRYAFIDSAGELTYQDVTALRRVSASCRCVSLYRVTPAGQPLAAFAVPDTWSRETAPLRVPLGTEVDGIQLDLLNSAGRLGATGEVGEICVAGQRTGDLGRRLHDGTLEIAGRMGAGATTAGYPADPAETVVTLRDLPEVRDAIVTEYLDSDGRAALAAYIGSQDPALSTTGLRQHLLAQLPEYLVPEQLVLLDRLPLTPDGDYDLAALPVPSCDPAPAQAYVAPRTPMERRLAEIFEELLGLDRVGVHDTFFELNGFSLLATQLASRIYETFTVELTLRDVFQSPTVEGLAQLIVQAQAELAGAEGLRVLLTEIE